MPLPAIENGPAGKAGMASHGRHRKRCLSAGFWPAIHAAPEPTLALAKARSMKRSRQQSRRDLLEASQAMPCADECGLWLETAARAKPARPLLVGADESAPWARDPETRRHYWMGHYP